MSSADSDRRRPPPADRRDPGNSDLAVRIDDAAVFVTGDLDASTSHLLLAALEYLQARGRAEIHVDLADVDLIESEGIRVLFEQQNALAAAGGQLSISAPPALLARLALCRVEPGASHPE